MPQLGSRRSHRYGVAIVPTFVPHGPPMAWPHQYADGPAGLVPGLAGPIYPAMPKTANPRSILRRPSRRVLLAGFALAALPGLLSAAALIATPRQTAGPFYPRTLPLDSDSDLVQVQGRPEQAAGQVTHIFGRVLDRAGRPQPGVRIEIWQCDAFGHYHHVGDDGGADPNFQGFGRRTTDADGAYRFRTIRPVPYPGRTPHIHFAVAGPGFERLTTQMYVAGEPLNERDFLYASLRDLAARAVTVALEPAPEVEPGALAGTFDIVLG
jgi:protocatechuate 3,4-dioxygenase beta subunit